jgi:tetratricopeptide (TPR) repeat protein
MKISLSSFIAIIVLLIYPQDGIAQASKLQTGKEYFLNGSYFKALEYFNQVISTERNLPAEAYTEAYYYRGLTFIRLHNEAFGGNDKALQKQFADALLSAYEDFKSSLGYDDGRVWKQIDLELRNLHHPLLQEGLASLNTYNDLVFSGKSDPELLARAEKYLLAAREIRETYLVCDLLGQVYLDKGMKKEALESFSRAEQLYTAKLPDEPDFYMAYVFYRIAAIYKTDSIRLALNECQRGLNLLQSEYQRYGEMKTRMKPERAGELEEQYKLADKDLNDLKLDLYLSSQELYVEALHVFEEKLSEDPGDVQLLIGYASLLEKSDREKAIKTYEKALNVDPNQAIALFNLGALHYAKGRDLYDKSRETSEQLQYDLLIAEAESQFTEAKVYFEHSLEVDPASVETVSALKTIAFLLDDQPSYNHYKAMEENLSK